jgi:hypothetical protein
MPADPAEVQRFFEIISTQAQHACAGLEGYLQISRLNPADNKLRISGRFALGDVEHMTKLAVEDAATGHNTYIEARIIRRDTEPKERGKAAATVGVFALVGDSDADTGKIQRPLLPPSLVTETSPGNRHNWFFLSEAIPHQQAEEIGAGMRGMDGDHDTGTPTQPYRIAGTPNYPNLTKQKRGRFEVHPTRILECSGKLYSAAQLRAAFPVPEQKHHNSSTTNVSAIPAEWDELPDDLKDLIENGAQLGDDRSAHFHHTVGWLKQLHWSKENIVSLLERHPKGISDKYNGRLADEVGRSFDKCTDPPDAAGNNTLGGNDTITGSQDTDTLRVTAASDVDMCGIDWFWPSRFALGKIGLVAGLPDYGKGQIAAFLAAAATSKVALPCNEGTAPQGRVLWFNAEDDVRDTIKPRLLAAGADPGRVTFINGAHVKGKDKSFSLVTDLPLLRKKIKRSAMWSSSSSIQ